jgi:L-iditol 2-dehydrogenase
MTRTPHLIIKQDRGPKAVKAARFYGPRDVRVEEVEDPVPAQGQLVIEVLASDMCGTDLKAYLRGHPLIKPPMTIGHEYCGIVTEAGEGSRYRKGDRVVASNSCPCMNCDLCKRGSYTICTSIKDQLVGFSFPGSYSSHMLVPEAIAQRNTYTFSRSSPEEIACAEPLAAAIHAVDRVVVSPGDKVAVVGAGALGLMLLQVLKSKEAYVLVANRSGGRLDLASKLGADEVLQVTDETLVERIRGATGGKGADLVVEAVGRSDTWIGSFGATRDGGQALMFGGCASGTQVPFDSGKLHYGETNIVGSFHHEPSSFRRAVEGIESGRIRVSPFITRRMKLEEIVDAFGLMERREAMKVAIVP